MSVQKYRVVKGEGHTSISNKVIELLKNNLEALGLYTYLMHLPSQWEFHKKQLREATKIGINKLDALLAYLTKVKLIQIIKERDALGRFAFFDMHVMDEPSTTMETMGMESMPMENSTYKRNNIKRSNIETLSHQNDDNLNNQKEIENNIITLENYRVKETTLEDLKTIKDMTPELMNHEYIKFKEYYKNHTLTADQWDHYLRMWMLRAADYKKVRTKNVR